MEFYKTKRGDNPIFDYILEIDDIDEVADIMETIEQIDQKGAVYLINGGEITRSLGEGLWEIKKCKNRFYYIYCSCNRVYMLHACYKQKGRAEINDIDLGKKRMKEMQLKERVQLNEKRKSKYQES